MDGAAASTGGCELGGNNNTICHNGSAGSSTMSSSRSSTMRRNFDERSFKELQLYIEEIERVALSHGLIKVNTAGSTLLFVYGLDVPVTAVDAIRTAVGAVWSVVEDVFIPSSPDVTFHASVHTGPCFGAVVGSRSMSFDVFGFAVSTAHRLLETAPRNSVHVGVSALERLGEDGVPSGAELTTCSVMEVKGLGLMSTYALIPRYEGDA
eukprot:PhM_4_TR15931/c3_g1_i4/m.197